MHHTVPCHAVRACYAHRVPAVRRVLCVCNQVGLGHGTKLRDALLRLEEENKGAMHVDPWWVGAGGLVGAGRVRM